MDIAKSNIHDGYITSGKLLGMFSKRMNQKRSKQALKEYKTIKTPKNIGRFTAQEWDEDLFNSLIEQYADKKVYFGVESEIPEGYVTSTYLWTEFIKKTSQRRGKDALVEYQKTKAPKKVGRHTIQEWDKDLFNELADKYKTEKTERKKRKKATYKNPEIPEGYITSTSLFDEFVKQLSYKKAEAAVRDYKKIKGSRRLGRSVIQEWDKYLFDELIDKHITIRAANRKGYTQREIPQGYIIATQLFEKFSKILKPSKGKMALADYQAVKTPQKYGRHYIQEWDEDLFDELVEKYEEKRKVAVKKIKKPVIYAGLSPEEILEKAKELNRKVKVVPMGYSPSWEREKKVIKEQKEQFDKSEYKPKDYSIHTPKGNKIHVPEGYLKVKDLREKFLEETGSYVLRLDMEYRNRVNELILGSVKAYEWNEDIFKEVTSNYKRKKRYKKW